ncbi:MAG: class I SAM-dependent methyltransferase [Planctomycetaceae bacterium]|nr:class I SAM-dependent methyltransferase [Planctomycetaceae bacterium]
MTESWRNIVVDCIGLQLNAYTWYRYGLIQPFLIPGRIRALNIGTGGGFETLRLLRRGSYVTTIEIDDQTARRTRERVARHRFSERHTGLVGHVLEVPLEEQFHEILMCEVLEHILDDRRALTRLSRWLLPGGRLILSTPTASYGLLPGDTISPEEDGNHVRVGYDGPELDEMLRGVGLVPIRRIYNGNLPIQWNLLLERRLRDRPLTRPLAYALALLSRPLLPVADLIPFRPFDQITIATKA